MKRPPLLALLGFCLLLIAQVAVSVAAGKPTDPVYVLPTGTVYHKAGCPHLKQRTPLVRTRQEAEAEGRRACRDCRP